jgi:hypothetical protein
MDSRQVHYDKGPQALRASLNTVKRMAAEHPIDVVDLFASFHAFCGPRPLYFRTDVSLDAGRGRMAHGLEEYLVGAYLAKWCGGGTPLVHKATAQ